MAVPVGHGCCIRPGWCRCRMSILLFPYGTGLRCPIAFSKNGFALCYIRPRKRRSQRSAVVTFRHRFGDL